VSAGTRRAADLWEVLQTTRAVRRFTPEPVGDDVLIPCLEAATFAPSGGNQQPWRFVVLRSAEARAIFAVAAQRALEMIESVYRMSRPAPEDQSPRARSARAVYDLHDGAANIPAALLACVRPLPKTSPLLQGANIYPAVQNFLLAARAQGLGTVLTGWNESGAPELRAHVGVPAEWELAAFVAVGWPRHAPGPVRRKPVHDVVAFERWEAGGAPETAS
jgi:nitroreductase